MPFAIASDHAGFRLKEAIRDYLDKKGLSYHDFGSEEPADYTDQALLVAEAVAKGQYQFGILVCGTGIGMAITANKVTGIRAAVCHDTFSARMAREHNDSNILTMGERIIGVGLALDVVEAFLGAEFLGGRHAMRVDKIVAVERKYSRET